MQKKPSKKKSKKKLKTPTIKPTKMNQVAPEIVISPVATPPSAPSLNASIITRTEPKTKALQPPRSSLGADSNISQHSTRSQHTMDVEHREKLGFEKTSQERKDYLSAIRPHHSRLISGWTSKGYYASSQKGCPPGMEAIGNLKVFFISRAGRKFDAIYDIERDLGPAKYQVFSANGLVHFFGVETLQAFESYPYRIRDVDLTAAGAKGGIVFQITGTNKVAKVKNDDKVLGSIVRYGLRPTFQPSSKHWSYRILDAGGSEVCRFDRRRGKGVYNLYVPGDKTSIGDAKEKWDRSNYVLPPTPNPDSVFGVDLSSAKVNPEHKTLILAATLLIYDNYIRKEDFGPNRSRFNYGLLYNLAIGAIILILTIVIIAATNAPRAAKKIACRSRR